MKKKKPLAITYLKKIIINNVSSMVCNNLLNLDTEGVMVLPDVYINLELREAI